MTTKPQDQRDSEANEPLGIASKMTGTGFTMVVFEAERVPAGTPVYARPAPEALPVGFIEARSLEKLQSDDFGAQPESHVSLWHAGNPPSRAQVPVYLAAPEALGAKLTDARIMEIRSSIKYGDGWDGDAWDLALARAIEQALTFNCATCGSEGSDRAKRLARQAIASKTSGRIDGEEGFSLRVPLDLDSIERECNEGTPPTFSETLAMVSRIRELEALGAAKGELSDAEIHHLWDTHVGEPSPSWPLEDKDKLAFARAILAAHSADARNEDAEFMRDAAMRTVQAMGLQYTPGADRWKPVFWKEDARNMVEGAALTRYGFTGSRDRAFGEAADGEFVRYADVASLLAAPAAPAPKCDTCNDTGHMPVGHSGRESDGNAMEFERCPECGYGDAAPAPAAQAELIDILRSVDEQFSRFGNSLPDGFDSRVLRWVKDALAGHTRQQSATPAEPIYQAWDEIGNSMGWRDVERQEYDAAKPQSRRILYTTPADAASEADKRDWQPIETAPKTGRTLLLGYHNSAGNWRTVRGQWMSDAYIQDNWDDPDSGVVGWYETSAEADEAPSAWHIKPTHWMPTPAEPCAFVQRKRQQGAWNGN